MGFLFPIFTLNYLTKTLHMPKTPVLSCITLGYVVSLFTIPMFSALSDRIGRRPVYMGAAIFCALFAFPFFWLISTQNVLLIGVAFVLAIGIGTSGMFGPQAAYFAELFSTRLRYSGFAFARELGSVLAGGPAPFLSTLLVSWAGGQIWPVAVYVIVLALLTALALYFGPETYKSDITVEAVEE